MARQKYFYLKIRFKDYYNGRKIYYLNDYYISDCVNTPFKTKEEAESYIKEIKYKYGDRIESITTHFCY